MIRRPPRSTLFPSRRSSDLMDPAVLSWDNASNNQWLNSGAGSWIHNPISHYVVAKEKKMPVAEQIGFHVSPAGPGGRPTRCVAASRRILEMPKKPDIAPQIPCWCFGTAAHLQGDRAA